MRVWPANSASTARMMRAAVASLTVEVASSSTRTSGSSGSAGDRDALALAAGKRTAGRADIGSVASRQCLRERRHLGAAGRLQHLGLAHRGRSVTQILQQTALEQHEILLTSKPQPGRCAGQGVGSCSVSRLELGGEIREVGDLIVRNRDDLGVVGHQEIPAKAVRCHVADRKIERWPRLVVAE